MLLIELATQNVRGFSPTARAALKPGYNVLVPPPGAQPGLLAILSALYYSDGTSDAALATGPQARAGLTAQGPDGRVYRLVRGLGGGGALHRLEPNNQWAVVAQDPVEVARHLRATVGVPSREAFDALFCFSPYSLPSRQRAAESKAAGSVATGVAAPEASRAVRPNALVAAAMAAASRNSAGAHQVDALRAEVQAGKALEEQQYRLEGMHQRIFQLENLVSRGDVVLKKIDGLKQALAATRSLESLGLDASALKTAERYDEAQKRLKDQLLKLAQEETFGTGGEVHTVAPLWKDQAFLAGAGVGTVAMAAGLALRSSAAPVSLLAIPAFGYAGLCALRWIGKLQRVDSQSRRQSVTKDREQKLYAAFDADFLFIKGAMKVLELEEGKEFLEYFGKRQQLENDLAAAEAELQAVTGAVDYEASVREHAQLSAEARQLEAQISEAGAGMTRDWREAERELQDLEGGGAEPQADALVAASGGSFGVGSGPSKHDPAPKLLAAAQELFAGASLQSLGAAMRERVSQYIGALTDRRYTGVEFDAQGGTQLVAPGRVVPAGQAEDLDLDLLYIAVKLTIVERYSPLGKPVLLLEEPFLGLEDGKLQLLSRMLKHIGTLTQVVHATALPAHHGLADALHQA